MAETKITLARPSADMKFAGTFVLIYTPEKWPQSPGEASDEPLHWRSFAEAAFASTDVGKYMVARTEHLNVPPHTLPPSSFFPTEDTAKSYAQVDCQQRRAALDLKAEQSGKTPGEAIFDLLPDLEPSRPVAEAENILRSVGFVGKLPPSRIAAAAAKAIAENFARPPFSIAADCKATVVDREGRPVLTVDVNGEREDDSAAALAWLLLAILDSLCVPPSEAPHG